MIIYIEGVDGSGKTTLMYALKEKLLVKGYKINMEQELAKLTHPNNPDRCKSRIDYILKMAKMIESDTVYLCDRGPLSDIIYRTFDTQDPVITFKDLVYIKDTDKRKFIMVLCDTDKSEELMMARGEDNPVAINRHREIRYLYQQLAWLLDSYKYDLTHNDPVKFINKIVKELK